MSQLAAVNRDILGMRDATEGDVASGAPFGVPITISGLLLTCDLPLSLTMTRMRLEGASSTSHMALGFKAARVEKDP